MKYWMWLLQGLTLLTAGSYTNNIIEEHLVDSGGDFVRIFGGIVIILSINFVFGWWSTKVNDFFKWEKK